MAEERMRVEFGFDGGQGMVVHVDAPTADALERALAEAPEEAFAFDADDGRYTVRLNRVVYVKRLARESRVGFGA
ncbi:MAG: hypothetical protein ICV64_12735 [Thermoleophilia bacterium]|nr:hypothetical protein [Thermoleophilia bacterium]